MSSLTLSDYVDDFLIAKEIEEGCASSTIKAYRYDLEMFLRLMGDLEIEDPLLRQKIRLFLKKLKDRDYSKKGLARKIASLRSFFKFLTLNEFISKNPMRTIKTPKIRTEEALPKFLTLKEMEKIFSTLIHSNFSSKKKERYYLIVRLLYASMARVSELCGIKIKDIDFSNHSLKLRGKGNKERIVPLDKKTLEIIKESLENRIIYSPDDFLLINTQNNPLTPRAVQMDIQAIKDLCNFADSKTITPHVFRHTGATHLRRSGMDISELQDILGHSSPNTTRIYAKNDISTLKQSYNKMHPLSKSKSEEF
ncbi:MAG: hypothetical protein EU544_03530 [Promethearchaeota archaeon]|nr:MAG: hypothetical protein EU544_03530 [Candidatus Lokiarchaeota archaeon]